MRRIKSFTRSKHKRHARLDDDEEEQFATSTEGPSGSSHEAQTRPLIEEQATIIALLHDFRSAVARDGAAVLTGEEFNAVLSRVSAAQREQRALLPVLDSRSTDYQTILTQSRTMLEVQPHTGHVMRHAVKSHALGSPPIPTCAAHLLQVFSTVTAVLDQGGPAQHDLTGQQASGQRALGSGNATASISYGANYFPTPGPAVGNIIDFAPV